MATYGFLRKPELAPKPQAKERVVDPLESVSASIWNNYVPYIIEDDYKAVNKTVVLTDTNENTITVDKLNRNQYNLMLRFSFGDCASCIKVMMEELKALNLQGNVFAVTNSYSFRDFMIKTSHAKYSVPTYSIGTQSLGLFMENKNFPFFFVLTPDNRAIKIFLPVKEKREQIKNYLSKVMAFIQKANNELK